MWILMFVFGCSMVSESSTSSASGHDNPGANHREGDIGTEATEVKPHPPCHCSLPPEPTPPKPAPPGSPVTLHFVGNLIPTGMELFCDGYRARAPVQQQSVTFSNVTATNCKVIPKGGLNSSDASVQVGHAYTCEIVGTTLTCK